MSKVDEIVMLYNMSSAMWTERSSAQRTFRSSASGRFLIMVFKRTMRCSDIPRAVEEETRKASSDMNILLGRGWQKGVRIVWAGEETRWATEGKPQARGICEVLCWGTDGWSQIAGIFDFP